MGAISCPHTPTNGVMVFPGLFALGVFIFEEGTVPLRGAAHRERPYFVLSVRNPLCGVRNLCNLCFRPGAPVPGTARDHFLSWTTPAA